MTDDICDYCDGCKHSKYEVETGTEYCELDREPQPHVDEPEHLHCDNKEDD